MRYRILGRTNLEVSEIALGTAAIGLDYGIAVPGDFGRLTEDDAVRLIQRAADLGINLFDTAPGYGESERLLGLALGHRHDCFFATKVPVPVGSPNQANADRAVRASLENSARALRRDRLDVVQIHNATVETIARGDVAEVFLRAQKQGLVGFIGASVYGEEVALAAIEAGCFDVVQVAFNLLDQRPARRVFPAARRSNVGAICRSALLKGVLSGKAAWLPPELDRLRQAVSDAVAAFGIAQNSLPQCALRFCLSVQGPSTVLIGARTVDELDQAIGAAEAGGLEDEVLALAEAMALDDERLVNPVHWPVA